MQSCVKQYGAELLRSHSSEWQSNFPFAYVSCKGTCFLDQTIKQVPASKEAFADLF